MFTCRPNITLPSSAWCRYSFVCRQEVLSHARHVREASHLPCSSFRDFNFCCLITLFPGFAIDLHVYLVYLARGSMQRTKLDTMTAATNQESLPDGTFDFFDLPREMRDLIYDELYTEACGKLIMSECDGDGLDCYTTGPIADCFLINRQFKQEYEQHARFKSCLRIRDNAAFAAHEGMKPLSIPSNFCVARKVELELFLSCNEHPSIHSDYGCQVPGEVEMHCRWIQCVLEQILHLERLSIRILLKESENLHECRQVLFEKYTDFLGVQKLESIEVCSFASSIAKIEEPFIPLMRWSTEEPTMLTCETSQQGRL